MDLGELGDFLDGSFDFTIGGRHYSVPPVEWPVYLELFAAQEHAIAVEAGRAKPEDGPEDKPIYKLAPTLLGPVLDQLIGDGVSGAQISLIARAAYLFQIGEGEVARAVLKSGGKAPTPDSTSTSTTPTGSTGTGKANTTRRRGSTTGTTSRRKSPTQSVPEPVPSTP